MTKDMISGMKQNAPQTNKQTVAEIIAANQDFFKTYFAKEKSRLIAIETATAIGNDPKFKNCTPESIVRAIKDAVRIGFPISTAVNYFWLVPYKQSVQLQISAKGFTQLLYRAGWLVSCEPVYSCDNFSEKITQDGKQIELIPSYDDREEDDREWVYKNLSKVLVTATNHQGQKIHKIVTRKQIEKLRLTSPGQVYANQYTSAENRKRIAEQLPVDIWYEWYEEMAFAKAIKKAAKLIPHGDILLEKALKLDSLASAGEEAEYVSVSESLGEVETLPLIEPKQPAEPKQPEKPEKELPQNDDLSYNSLNELVSLAEMLGFEVSGPTDNGKGRFWLKATKMDEEADIENLAQLGFSPMKNFFVKEVTVLVGK